MHAKPTHRKARPKAREHGCAFRFGYNRSAKVVIPIKLCKFFHIRDFSAHQEITNLLSTGKCKIIDLSEENILGRVKI